MSHENRETARAAAERTLAFLAESRERFDRARRVSDDAAARGTSDTRPLNPTPGFGRIN